MCELGKPTVIRWEVDPAVHGSHNRWAVWCNGKCIQTPSGQPSPAVMRKIEHVDGTCDHCGCALKHDGSCPWCG